MKVLSEGKPTDQFVGECGRCSLVALFEKSDFTGYNPKTGSNYIMCPRCITSKIHASTIAANQPLFDKYNLQKSKERSMTTYLVQLYDHKRTHSTKEAAIGDYIGRCLPTKDGDLVIPMNLRLTAYLSPEFETGIEITPPKSLVVDPNYLEGWLEGRMATWE